MILKMCVCNTQNFHISPQFKSWLITWMQPTPSFVQIRSTTSHPTTCSFSCFFQSLKAPQISWVLPKPLPIPEDRYRLVPWPFFVCRCMKGLDCHQDLLLLFAPTAAFGATHQWRQLWEVEEPSSGVIKSLFSNLMSSQSARQNKWKNLCFYNED